MSDKSDWSDWSDESDKKQKNLASKHIYRQIGGLLLILLSFCKVHAYDFADRSRGVTLYYNILSQAERTVELTHGGLENAYEERSYTIPRSVRHKGKRYRVVGVGKRAFARCNQLTSITFSNHITRIDSAAFIGCVSLWKVRFPEKLSYIGDRAFYGCESLTYVEIPRRVEHIGTAAFSSCTAMVDILVDDRNVRYSDAGGSSCILDKQNHTLVQGCENTVVPEETTVIGAYAFEGCESLRSVELPSRIERIDEKAYWGCHEIESVRLKAFAPPVVSEDAFPDGTGERAKFSVPYEAVTLYMDAPVWKNFTNY